MNKVEVEQVEREVIDKKLLVLLDDKSKVAVLLDADDLKLMITVLEDLNVANVHLRKEKERCSSLLNGLHELEREAFGKKS